MYRVIAFTIGVVVCFWVLSPSYAQKDPKPYDDSKPKKSSAKADTTKAEESDESKTDKAKTDKSKSDKSKSDKSKSDKSKSDKSKADESKTDKSKTDKSKTDKSKAKEPETKKSETEKAKKSEVKKPEAEKAQPTKSETGKAVGPESTASRHVVRAAFTSAVVDREPADSLKSLTTEFDKVFFFTEIANMEGRQVKHQWIYDGKVVAEVPFQIGGPRWRIYSSKRLMKDWVGQWTVAVVDETGRKLREDSFAYVGSAQ
jgi:hypothetical protein